MSLYSDGMDVLGGFGWQDALATVHGVGKGVLSAFGAGAAGEALEDVYKKQGWLPTQAPAPGSTPGAPGVAPGATPAIRPGVYQSQAQIAAQQALLAAQIAAQQKAQEKAESQRFWRNLILGGALIGTGIVAYKVLSPRKPESAPAAGG